MLYNDEASKKVIVESGRALKKGEGVLKGETEIVCLSVICQARQAAELYCGDMDEANIADAVKKFDNGERAVDNATGYFRMAVPTNLLNAVQ